MDPFWGRKTDLPWCYARKTGRGVVCGSIATVLQVAEGTGLMMMQFLSNLQVNDEVVG